MNNQDSHCRCGTDGEQVTTHSARRAPGSSETYMTKVGWHPGQAVRLAPKAFA